MENRMGSNTIETEVRSLTSADREEYATKVQRRRSCLLNIPQIDRSHDAYTQFLRQAGGGEPYQNISNYLDDEFTEEAFCLPDEEMIDKRAYERRKAKKQIENKLKVSQLSQQHTLSALKKLDEFELKSLNEQAVSLKMIPSTKNSKVLDKSLRVHRVKRVNHSLSEGKLELNVIKAALTQKTQDLSSLNDITTSNLNTKLPSTIDHPKVGSIEEKLEDLRQVDMERWCKKHGKSPAVRLLNNEKKVLRKWFQEIDEGSGGEVTVAQLQDALLSSGLFKTREQVVRVLSNMNKNSMSEGADFEEFLQALYSTVNTSNDYKQHLSNQIRNEKLKRLQDMCANPLGFSMNTLLTEERRIKFLRSIFHSNRSERRTAEAEKQRYLHDRYIESLETVVLEQRLTHHHEEHRDNHNHMVNKIKNYQSFQSNSNNNNQHKFHDVEDASFIKARANLIKELSLPAISVLSNQKGNHIVVERSSNGSGVSGISSSNSSSSNGNNNNGASDLDRNTRNKYAIYAPLSNKNS